MALGVRRLSRMLTSWSRGPRFLSTGATPERLFTDVLDPDITAKPSILEVMNPDRLHSLRTKPFLYKIVNILRDPDKAANLKESLQVWEGFVSVALVGEALKHVEDARAALAFFNWAAAQQGYKHNGYTYNCLIRSLELCYCYPIIYNIFQRMLYIKVELTSFTFDVTLRSLGRTGELDKLKLVCLEMDKRKLSPHPSTYESILICYCKNGEVKDAYDVFAQVTKWPDPICFPHVFYNRFIEILAETGNVAAAYLIFKEMIDNGYEGEQPSVGRLMTALHKARLDRMACKVFDELARRFQTAFTGRMGKPGDSIADHYLYNARRIRRRWREEVLKPPATKYSKRQLKAKASYGGPTSLAKHCW